MFIRAALSWGMLPIYVWQGLRVRMTIERLLPAKVPAQGVVGQAHRGKPIKMLVLGDSTIASVGMETLEETFAYNVAQAISTKLTTPVHWRAVGANSATSGDIRDYVLPNIEERDWTHIFVSVGINDMKNFHLVSRFKKNFGTLLYALRARFPNATVIWTPIPNMRPCPAIPNLLSEVLAARADLINAMGKRMCQERQAIATDPVQDVDETCFARDGFHPNGKGYAIWANHVAHWFESDEGVVSAEVTKLPKRA
ncbi:MAG: SGNH/GDSL hydrolase family protein [Pseudomonadota bacterium]